MKVEHRADVWVGNNLAGELYDDGRHIELRTKREVVNQGGKFSFDMPFRENPYQFPALPPYFANLLPEGRRLSALREAVKRSGDDELGLLLRVGLDLIGDTAVVPPGADPHKAMVASEEAIKLPSVSFQELFEESLNLEGSMGRGAVPGVQDKLSESMISFPIRRNHYGPAILKLNTESHPQLVENESFFLKMAKGCGLKVSPFEVVYDREGKSGLLVRRFDREEANEKIRKLHVEDGCQLLGVYARAKYDVTVREILEVTLDVTKNPAVLLTAVDHFAFHYLIADGDHHAKNYSLLEGGDGVVTMAPAYDVLTTLLYNDDRMALGLEGRDKNWKQRDFLVAWGRVGVSGAAVTRRLGRLVGRIAKWLPRLDALPFDEKAVTHLRRTIERRMDELNGEA